MVLNYYNFIRCLGFSLTLDMSTLQYPALSMSCPPAPALTLQAWKYTGVASFGAYPITCSQATKDRCLENGHKGALRVSEHRGKGPS